VSSSTWGQMVSEVRGLRVACTSANQMWQALKCSPNLEECNRVHGALSPR
jgi:hypothetical protein